MRRKVVSLQTMQMNLSPALLFAGGLLAVVGQVVSACQQTNLATVAGTPSPSPTPVPVMDLGRFTPDDLAAYAGYCDTQVKAALARGDTAAALGWAHTRNDVQAAMKRYPSQDRSRSRPRHHAAPSRPLDQLPPPTPSPKEPTRRPGYLLPPNWPTG